MKGMAPVESKGEFLQIVGQLLSGRTTLENTEQPAFQESGNTVNPRQWRRPLFCGSSSMGLVNIPRFDQVSVGEPTVRHDGRSGRGDLPDESGQVLMGTAGNHLQAKPAHTLSTDLDCCGYHRLGPERHPKPLSVPRPLISATDIEFIDLDLSSQRLPIRPDHRPPQLMEAHPSRSVASEPKSTLEPQGTDASLLVGEPPHGPEPQSQRQMATMEDCPRCGRDHGTAIAALPNPAGKEPCLSVTAPRTPKAVWPPNLDQISAAVVFCSELPFKLKQVMRIEFSHTTAYIHVQGESSAYAASAESEMPGSAGNIMTFFSPSRRRGTCSRANRIDTGVLSSPSILSTAPPAFGWRFMK